MTTAAPTVTDQPGNCWLYHWSLTSDVTDGDAVSIPGASDRSVVFSGTWGSSTALLEGSLDGTTFLGLTDPQGNAISKTANAIEAVTENALFIRPRLSDAGTGAAVEVYLFCRSTMHR